MHELKWIISRHTVTWCAKFDGSLLTTFWSTYLRNSGQKKDKRIRSLVFLSPRWPPKTESWANLGTLTLRPSGGTHNWLTGWPSTWSLWYKIPRWITKSGLPASAAFQHEANEGSALCSATSTEESPSTLSSGMSSTVKMCCLLSLRLKLYHIWPTFCRCFQLRHGKCKQKTRRHMETTLSKRENARIFVRIFTMEIKMLFPVDITIIKCALINNLSQFYCTICPDYCP